MKTTRQRYSADFKAKVALGRIAARRNAAAKRILKPAND
jgi:hypothetical protein